MWTGLGEAYEKLSRYSDAIKCFKRACFDTLGVAKLAKCYMHIDESKAAFYWKVVYNQELKDQEFSGYFAEACLFLGRKMFDEGRIKEAVTSDDPL